MRREMILQGLDCANCAAQIEDEINQLGGVRANVNLISQSMTLETDTAKRYRELLPQVKAIVHKHEPDVKVLTAGAEGGGNEDFPEAAKSGFIEYLPAISQLLLSGLILAVSLIFDFNPWLELALYLTAYLLVGGDVLMRAVKSIHSGQVFSEYSLMSIATIGALLIGEYTEAVAVMLFYQVGELFQNVAAGHSRRSISALMKLRPDKANLLQNNEVREVSPGQVQVGDTILVRPGERIPLDGTVLSGSSLADTSALTGESLPRSLESGNEALSGMINLSSAITITVTKPVGESTVSKILDLVQNAAARKAPTEKLISRFARWYTPVVVFTAIALAALPPLLIPGASFTDWIYRALVFLVISCPCALVISVPLAFFGGIGGASRRGILVKGSNYLEALTEVDTVVFDKTGTLTQGSFSVIEISPAEGFSEGELLEAAAYAEGFSTHPIASSIKDHYGQPLDLDRITSHEEIPGQGLDVTIDEREVLAGNDKLMQANGISVSVAETISTAIHVAIEGRYAGYILIADTLKPDTAVALGQLKELGIKRTIMLTGDSEEVAETIGREAGVDEIRAGLLPADKLESLDAIRLSDGKIAAVGDGINDAPLLAAADVGMAMGGLGSDAAIEAADIVLMTDEPSQVAAAIRIARRTRTIAWQNIVLSLTIKVCFLILGALGVAGMWEAVFADVGVTVLAVINSTRALHTGRL